MKKDYEKPVLEVVEFEYEIQTEGGSGDNSEEAYNVGGWFI